MWKGCPDTSGLWPWPKSGCRIRLHKHSACFLSSVVIFVMWMVLLRWICDSLNPLLTKNTVWRAWDFVTTSYRFSKEFFLPAEERLMRPRNRVRAAFETRGIAPLPFATFFPLYLLLFCCLSVVRVHCAVLLSGWSFCRTGTAQHTLGSRCVHTHPTQRPFSSHAVKSHTQMTWRGRGCFCHDLWGLLTLQTAHLMRHQLQGNSDTFLWWAPRTHHDLLPPCSRPTTSSSDFLLHSWFSISQFIVLAPRWWTVTFYFLFQPVLFPQAELPLSLGNCKCHVLMHCYGKL